jgi:hypothetical protein
MTERADDPFAIFADDEQPARHQLAMLDKNILRRFLAKPIRANQWKAKS